MGHRKWLGVYLDVGDLDWDEIGEIVIEAYRVIAPPTLVARISGDNA